MTLEDRLSALEARLTATEAHLREAQDRLEILQLVATYGPAVDSGAADATAGLWVHDGVYDTYPHVFAGQEEIAAMVGGERHQGLIHNGAAHLLGIPHITIDADTAVVTNYSQLVRRDPNTDSFTLWRTGVNRWELRREANGEWKVVHRANRQLDGTPEARALLGQGLES